MRRLTIAFWIFNGLFAAFMILAGIPDLMVIPEAAALFERLGYPVYLLPFLGLAKILGGLAVLLPAPATLKEWAYAGLTFDLLGALYSYIRVGDSTGEWVGSVIGLVLLVPAYALYRKRRASLASSFGTTATS